MPQKQRTVLYITRYYRPSTSAAGIRAGNFVDALLQRNLHVIVVTVGSQAKIEKVSDRLTVCWVSLNGRLPCEMDGQDRRWPWWSVLPGPDPPGKSSKTIYRACQWLIEQYRPNLVFVTGPPFSLMALTCELAAIYHLPMILEFRDAWYTAMPWPYKNVLERLSAKRWERRCVSSATRIITVTDAYRQILIDTFGPGIAQKTTTIRHGFDACDIDKQPTSTNNRHTDEDKKTFTIAHIGQLRGFDIVETRVLLRVFRTIIHMLKRIFVGANFCEKLRLDWMCPHYLMKAVSQVASVNGDFARRVRLVFAGEKFPQIDTWAQKMNLTENIEQYGSLPPEQARQLARQADLLVLMLYGIKNCSYHWCVPSKVYTYLATGNPILALLPPGEAKDLVTEAGTGIIAAPDDPCAIAKQLSRLFHEHTSGIASIRPNWDYIRQFELTIQQNKFADVILSVLADD